MEVEEYSDTPSQVVGMVFALKNLNFSIRKSQEYIEEWGFRISHSTVWRLFKSFDSGSNCGRVPIIEEKSKNKITDFVLASQTIRNVLKDEGLRTFKPVIVNFINEGNKQKRKNWCKQRLKWNVKDWQKVVFTDKSLIQASSLQIKWVRKYEGEVLDEDNCITKLKWNNNIRITVWRGITHLGPQSLYFAFQTVNSELYKQILEECLCDFKGLEEGELIFMQDNAPAHSPAKKLLEEKGIERLDWPAQSLYLKSIENLWAIIKDKIWKVRDELKSKEDLMERIEDIWFNDKSLVEICKNLYESLPERISIAYHNNGDSCRY